MNWMNRVALTALFIAFALTILVPTNAAAQQSVLRLGTVSGINLNLSFPVTTANGRVYYFLDRNGNGAANPRIVANIGDSVTRSELKNLLTGDANGDITDAQESARSVIVGGYTLVLPNNAEFLELQEDPSNAPTGVPADWLGNNNSYASSTPGRPGFADNYVYNISHFGANAAPGLNAASDTSITTALAVAFQVIPPENLFFRIKVFLEGAQ